MKQLTQEFRATITKVGINPCVEIPQEASEAFDGLSKSRRKDILAYLNSLKRKESLARNVKKVLDELDK